MALPALHQTSRVVTMAEAIVRAPTRLLVLGIDATSPELVEQWTQDGTLPTLRALMARGLSGRTRGIEGFFIGSTWPSMYTGTTPARHGVHYLWQLLPGTYMLHAIARAAFVRREAFWDALSRAGRRVAVLDVPLTRLGDQVNGIQTVEWGGHDVYGFEAAPREFGDYLLANFGEHPAGTSCDRVRKNVAEWQTFIGALEEGTRRKAAWTRELLARGGWDLFFQVFTEGHCAGHQTWHLHDTRHPGYDAALAAEVGDPIRRVYQALDAAVGRVLEGAGDATVVVFAAHGMSYWYGAQFLLPQILYRLGVATPPEVPRARRRLRAYPRAAAAAVWHALPQSLSTPLRSLREWLQRDVEPAVEVPTIEADAARSQCFAVGNGLAVGGIRLNLIGREPQGMLRPGAEAHAFSQRLAADLLEIEDLRTGRPLIERVVPTAQLYQGEYLEHLPDLLVFWSDDVPTGSAMAGGGAGARVRVRSPKIGIVDGVNEFGRTGEHRPAGWFIAAGPDIESGRLDREVSLMDLAPTFARMLGVELSDCDGRVVPELLGNGQSIATEYHASLPSRDGT